ncbi:MAG TPA: hypothetical protein VES73_11590, partial [Lamprocystis sp. (in: g-proteobacteria)]|nr:hypothetical protein [Lamprocystis sp. (in: g-proteobacteria)]
MPKFDLSSAAGSVYSPTAATERCLMRPTDACTAARQVRTQRSNDVDATFSAMAPAGSCRTGAAALARADV